MSDSNPKDIGFVEDGRYRIMETAEYKLAADAVRAELLLKYVPAIGRAGGRRKKLLIKAYERTLARRLEALAPSDALYLSSP